jgi:hypothetical protein
MSRHERGFGGVGQRSPATALMLDERNALLAKAARFYPGMSQREIARRLRSRLVIYRNGRWRRSCAELKAPHPAEKIDAVLWMILRVKDYVPSEMTIRRALFMNHEA